MKTFDDPRMRGVHQILAAIESGSLKAETVFADGLDLIAEQDPDIRAWVSVNDAGLAQARRIDRGLAPHGGLTGVPLGVKDVIETRDLPTAYGSGLYAGHRPGTDAACVAKAKAEGALIMGKTVTTEFAFISPNETCNPHNSAHTPGGSSSGSAAAVAAGMVPVAYGTQTSGSIIRPASFCGVVGCKPSFGLIDRTGTKTLAQSLDTIGAFTRSVGDLGIVLAALSDRPALAEAGVPDEAPRIGLFLPPEADVAEDYTHEILQAAARAADAAGATVTDTAPTEISRRHLAIHEGVMDRELPTALMDERLHRNERLAPMTRQGLVDLWTRSSVETYDAAMRAMAEAQAGFAELIGENDVLLTFAAPGEAPEGLGYTGDPTFNRGWTMLRVPCVTLPAGQGPKGLPVGVQLVGRFGEDARVLRAAAFLENALAAA
ncbi:amidase [Marinibacterium profundimaris]|nr:amidase [Marinibacterium profundimaris]